MDQDRFDSLARSLASATSRRGLLGSLAALGAGLLGARAAGAQVTQAQCGNKVCASNPAVCTGGCVCCVYPNGNSRCRPPGACSPGAEVGGATTTTTPAPTSTTTTRSPTSTTTTSTSTSTSTTTTATTGTSTTTAAPTSTTTTTPAPGGCGAAGACGPGDACVEAGDCRFGLACSEAVGGGSVCCPAVGCGPCRQLDAACRCVPIPGSDGQACGDGRACCAGNCCVAGATCENGLCSTACLSLFQRCEDDGQCCSSDLAICAPTARDSFTRCCATLGGECLFEGGDCCNAPLPNFPGDTAGVICRDGVCGGVGANCDVLTVEGSSAPDVSPQCVSGACCLDAAGTAGICCDYGQECGEDGRCRPRG